MMSFFKRLFSKKKTGLEDFPPIKEAIKENDFLFVNLYSNSCLVCKRTKPIVDEVSLLHPNVKVLEILIDSYDEKQLKKYGIVFTPTLAFYDDEGNTVHRSVGLIDKGKLEKLFEISD